MAQIEKPKRSKKKGTPPKLEDSSQNLSKNPIGDLMPLNFKVPAEFKKDFKRYALDHDISMVALLMKAFDHYKITK